MDKENVYLYIMKYCYNKEWGSIICSKVGRTEGTYVEWNKSDTDKYYMVSLICRS